ncbi:MAG: acetaldehyde dehydrogenase, partial [Spirochaetia bacterium]|nr:acetaldehyde dehydrogenase [Spirochaetia bacterium]
MDRDLQSIQEVRDLVAKAKAAQAELAEFSQEKIDKICEAIAIEGAKNAERLAKMASEETGFGVWQDKILKNILGSTLTWEAIKNIKTV